MLNKRTITSAILGSVLLMSALAANASVMLGGTRVVLNEKDRQASIPLKNTGASPYVVQTWIDAGEGKNKVPLLVTPPLSRLDPGAENILRIVRISGDLPSDRETVFWLNVKEIPEKSDQVNVLQVAVRTRIKIFYRPAGLTGKPDEARSLVTLAVVPGQDGKGAALRVSNPSAYNLTFTGFKINGNKEQTKASMVLPFSSSDFPLTSISTPQALDVSYTTINDYGGETPEVVAKVAVGAASAAQPAAPVAGAASVEPAGK
ncbi:molecular chaperone [Collimonas pratensis]|uniref:Gram-negative pili assembly chaperone, C-terminal domain protein n=1 Tax=Collimonas pratensis TaxID=279113 RepID=A0ABM5Z967_9BURK|nr:molecular chaperone [Collimonas pratensis]AMP15572.1 gram-negative pili assembly chaperone, C-terminal domain protein [Collimonas pratensis]